VWGDFFYIGVGGRITTMMVLRDEEERKEEQEEEKEINLSYPRRASNSYLLITSSARNSR
jgi:hypothetical protein